MAHQVRYLNSIICFLLCIALSGCTSSHREPQFDQGLLIEQNDKRVSNKNGRTLFEKKPFSGLLYTLFPGTTDTASISSYLNGKEDGTWRKFYVDGRLRESRAFKEGKKINAFNTWWPNGAMQFSYIFNNDEYEGTCREWNEQGQLIKEMNYIKGHEEGPQKSWYDNGKVRANYLIKDGRRFGLLGTKNCVNVTDSIFQD